MSRQTAEQLYLTHRQRLFPSLRIDKRMAFHVHTTGPHRKILCCCKSRLRGGRRSEGLRPPEDGPDAGDEHFVVERLRQIVVRTEVETERDIGGRTFGGEEDYRQRRIVPANLLQHLVAVLLRHHDVQEQEVRPPFPVLGQRLLAVGGESHREPLLLEEDNERAADGARIVRNQDVSHDLSLLSPALRRRAAQP